MKFRITRLSGEVETQFSDILNCFPTLGSGLLAYPGKLKPDGVWLASDDLLGEFRITRLSGEVETCQGATHCLAHIAAGSGLLAYPGKLKPVAMDPGALQELSEFRITRLSGEVETRRPPRLQPQRMMDGFRFTRLFGEVETCMGQSSVVVVVSSGSGLFAYPGKLKLFNLLITWRKRLRFRITRLSGEVETDQRGCPGAVAVAGSGLLAYLGKLKHR